MDEHLAEVVPLGRANVDGPVPGPGHAVPSFLSSFVGRNREIHDVVALLGSARLITLTGAGGLGKTRLAVEVAERVAPGRAFFVNLASVRGAALVAEEIASAFAVGELRGRSLAEVLADALPSLALLVLDNCEQVIGPCADQADRLLRGCRGLQILATSQQRLGVTGEVVWPVPALALPEESAPDVASDVVLDSPAVQLFCQRAAAVKRGFVATGDTLEAVVEICRRLDGNPLAIELAAARTDVLSPSDLAARLEDRFGLLRGGSGGPARHRTLAAALEWSHDLLSEPERVLLRRLSVFAGRFSLPAVEEVCVGGEVDRHQVLDLLSGLVAKSLVVADTAGTTARYRLLETVRHYAGEGLAATEAAEMSRRHACWYVEMVEHGTQAADEAAWLADHQVELDNARVALDWCLAEGQAELTLRLAGGLMVFWEGNGRFGEARDYLTRVLAANGSAPAALRAVALHDIGFAAFMLGDLDAARCHLQNSLALSAEGDDPAAAERTRGLLAFVSTFGDDPVSVDELEGDLDQVRAAGDDARLAEVLIACGQARLFRGEPLAAQPHFQELVALANRGGDDVLLATGLIGLGSAVLSRGEYASAEAHLRSGVDLAVGSAQAHSHAAGTAKLAELARLQGDHHLARARFEESLGHARAVGAPYPIATSLLGFGRVMLEQGEAGAARSLFDEAAAVSRQGGLAHLVASALEGVGEVAVTVGDRASARACFDEALDAARRCGHQITAASSTYRLAALARTEGDLDQATSLHHQALTQRQQVGDRVGVADSLEAMAGLAAFRDCYDRAARLFGAAQALRDTSGWDHPPRRGDAYDAGVALLRERMTPDELEQAWKEGAALACEEAVAYATKGRGTRKRAATGLDSLTPAERDVAALVAEGLTSPEIGERLFISPLTVKSHLRSMYAKLDVSSRRQLRQMLSGGE